MTTRIALNPLQWYAQPDGRLDFDAGPELPELLRQVAAAGFGAVHAEPGRLPVAEYRQALAEAGLEAAPGYLSRYWLDEPDPDTTDRAVRDFAERHAALGLSEAFVADELHGERLSRPATGTGPDPHRLDTLAARLDRAAAVAADSGISLCLHPHVGSWIETESEVRHVLDAAPRLAFGPDTGHLSWAGCDVLGLVRDYRDRVRAVHVKDVNRAAAARGRADGWDYARTVRHGVWQEPGRGDVPLDAVVDLLGPDFTGWWVVEVDHTELATPLDSARLSATWTDRHLRRTATA